MKAGAPIKLVDQRDLLEMLRHHPLSEPFALALYDENHGRDGLEQAIHTVCTSIGPELPCLARCYQGWLETVSQSLLTNQPVVTICPQGFLCVSIPLPDSNGLPDCLLGGGVFERNDTQDSTPGSAEPETAADLTSLPGQRRQLISLEEAEAIAEEIFRALPRLLDNQVDALSLSRTTQRLEATRKLARNLTDCPDQEQAVAIVTEALVVLFDLPKVLLIMQQPGQTMTVHSTLGLDADSFQIDQRRLTEFLNREQGPPSSLAGRELAGFFPGLDARSAYLFSLSEGESRHGAIAVFDVVLHERDLALIELLANRLTSRLEGLRCAAGQQQERLLSARLIDMISTLSMAANRAQLYQQILDMSAELLTATSGSLMLLDEAEGTLKIATAKGMTSSLASTMSVGFGEGIAGRVAKNGFPMLVNDIERDKRVAAKNRPRFKTKSFLSLPLETEERLIGVLNLADKKDGGNFTEADLNLVQTFTRHAVMMVDRAATLEKADQFEQLAITDPLTGLYNRRLLENRMQEEFSRSERQQQNFCIILADLDSFKIYNDICGHLAGDEALRKTAALLRHCAREMDIITRYGGEEFCLILPGTGKKESTFVGERIRRAIEAESFPGENHLPLGRLTISIGVSSYPDDGTTANELVHAADLALYRAKALGRNRLILYESSLGDQALRGDQK